MKMKLKIGLFLLSLFFIVAGYAQERVKVACIGNSITAGARIANPVNDAYPVILSKSLGDKYEVKNYGISGRTLLKNGDRPYWIEQYFKDAQEYQPDIVTIKLGTNDSKPMNWSKYSVEFEGDLREMITILQSLKSNPKIYLCYPIWANANGDGPGQIRENVISAEIIPIIQKVAEQTGVSIIDLHTTLYGMPQLLPDKIHPNELGHVLIAKTIYDRIK